MIQPSIAIIDDGINEKLYTTGELKHNIQITPELHIHERVSYDPFLSSHGTTCAAIIKKYAPDAVLSSVKILNDDSHMGMKAQLIRALEWCVQNKICLVNLSLGTIDYKDFIEVEKAVKYASENDVIIVAACNNRNIFTCPASLPDVIGVKCDTSVLLKEREYIYNSLPPDGIDITACGSHKLEEYNGKREITSACNSFATPAITALVYDVIKSNPGICLYELKELLKRKATKPNNMKIWQQYIEIGQRHIESSQQHLEGVQQYIVSEQTNSSRNFDNYKDKSIDIPIIVVYNYYGKKLDDFCRNLTGKFRIDGYNAISISEEAEQDLCNGRVSIRSYVNYEGDFFKGSIQMISNIFDPDIIIVPIDMTKDNQHPHMKEIESHLEVDIKIHIYENLNIEVMSINENGSSGNYQTYKYNEIKTFTLDDNQDDLYIYLLSLFETNEGRNETYKT